jgi:hypothetical protein
VTTDSETYDSIPEDMDVRKPRARLRRAGTVQSRRSIVAMSELLGGVSNASAEAFRSLNSAMTPDAVARAGLGTSLFNGVRDGNARFFEELSHTSRRVFEALRPPRTAEEVGPLADPESVARRLDYERLAQLVAAEMSKQPSSPAP